MSNRRIWTAGLALVALLAALLLGGKVSQTAGLSNAGLSVAHAQTPATSAPTQSPVAAPGPAGGSAPGQPAVVPTPGQTPGASPPAQTLGALPISGTFQDPQKRFEIGILETMTVSAAGGNPLFQQPDGNLAYTVAVVPLTPGTTNALPDVALLQAAKDTFGRGEGFQTTGFQAVEGGGLQISWFGRLSQGPTPPKPVSGSILAKQQGNQIFLLLVAALEPSREQVAGAIATLAPTLKVL
ncbi:MAG TPA: hypothetical protein V6D07_06550 [Trichocoleus sp.]